MCVICETWSYKYVCSSMIPLIYCFSIFSVLNDTFFSSVSWKKRLVSKIECTFFNLFVVCTTLIPDCLSRCNKTNSLLLKFLNDIYRGFQRRRAWEKKIRNHPRFRNHTSCCAETHHTGTNFLSVPHTYELLFYVLRELEYKDF